MRPIQYNPIWMLLRRRHDAPFEAALADWADILERHAARHQSRLPSIHRWRMKFLWRVGLRTDAFIESIEPDSAHAVISLQWWLRVQGMANRLFTCSDLALSIGDASREAGTLAERARDRAWRRDPDTPKCPLRQQASFVAAEAALTFIFLHEFGHLGLGHTEERRRLRERPRRFKQGRMRIGCLLAQVEELEADRFALRVLLHDMMKGGAFEKQRMPPELRPYLPELALVAQTLVHLAFRGGLKKLRRFNKSTHPHPLVRLLSGWTHMLEALDLPEARQRELAVPAADVFRIAALEGGDRWRRKRFTRLFPQARERLMVYWPVLGARLRREAFRFDEETLLGAREKDGTPVSIGEGG